MPLTRTLRAPAAALLALLAAPALAQSDDRPIPLPEQEGEYDAPARPRRPEVRYDDDDVYSRSGADDPNVGLSVEGLIGVMLLDSARGALVDTRLGLGARFTWELGRALGSEALENALFADVTWAFTPTRDGTQSVFVDTHYHHVTFAPAFAFPLGDPRVFAAYLQAGGGVAYQDSQLTVEGARTRVQGLKPVIQYGAGIRGRPALTPSESIRLSFRVELTRFRRAYMDDTFIGGSVGVTF